jgi:hypothetical protein
MLINFSDNITCKEKLDILMKYHNVDKKFIIDEADIPIVVIALNQDDVTEVKVDDDGSIEIGYHGDTWQNNEN